MKHHELKKGELFAGNTTDNGLSLYLYGLGVARVGITAYCTNGTVVNDKSIKPLFLNKAAAEARIEAMRGEIAEARIEAMGGAINKKTRQQRKVYRKLARLLYRAKEEQRVADIYVR